MSTTVVSVEIPMRLNTGPGAEEWIAQGDTYMFNQEGSWFLRVSVPFIV